MTIRLSEELHRLLKLFCARKGVTIQGLLERLIRREAGEK